MLVSIYLLIVNHIFISYGFCLLGYQHMVISMSILSKSNNNPSNVRPFLFRPMYCFIHPISFACYALLEDSWERLKCTVRRKRFFLTRVVEETVDNAQIVCLFPYVVNTL